MTESSADEIRINLQIKQLCNPILDKRISVLLLRLSRSGYPPLLRHRAATNILVRGTIAQYKEIVSFAGWTKNRIDL